MPIGEIILTLVMPAMTIFYCYFIVKSFKLILIPGIKTGRLQGRGIVFVRETNPFMFWLGVWFWLFAAFVALVLLYFSTRLVLEAARLLGVI